MSCSFYVLVTTVSWEAAVLRPTKFGLHNEMLTRTASCDVDFV